MKRLNYLDGLKGWCALSVCVLHFLLMFAINGYVGWKAMPESALQPAEYYFRWFPYSLLTNNSFPLYIFFALISFLVCYLFLKNRNEEKLIPKITMRYFRFLPIVAIGCLAAYVLLTFKLCPLQEYYEITGNTWGYARIEESYSLLDALKIGFVTVFFKGTQLVSPYWCMHYIFLGSILTFVMMLLFPRAKNKAVFFGFWILLFFFADQTYLAFFAGILAAIIANKEYALKKVTGALLVFGGCILGFFPPVWLPAFINIATLYSIGAALVIVGTHCCFSSNRLLCNRFMEFLGQESLAIIVWQSLVLQSLNVFLYLCFHKLGMDNVWNIAINFAINMTVSLCLTWISSKTITPLTNYLCKRVSTLL